MAESARVLATYASRMGSTQEIAETIGVSQSYVSRILRETLLDLRTRMHEVSSGG